METIVCFIIYEEHEFNTNIQYKNIFVYVMTQKQFYIFFFDIKTKSHMNDVFNLIRVNN